MSEGVAVWPMVGRDEELDLLHDLVVRSGRSVVLAGPAGVGKSRLATEFLDRIGAAGRRTVRVRATRATKTIPFGAFARWLPDASQLPPSRLHLLQAAARSMAGEGEPLVVGVDDAHLLDEGSVALVLHLLEMPSIAVVVTVRTDEPVSDDLTALWKDELAERIELDALSPTDVAALLERSLGGPVADDTAKHLWRLTSGRALFLREVVRAALDREVLQVRAGEWVWRGEFPGTERLTDLLRAQLDAAGPAQRQVVERVALGEPLPVEFLSGFDPDVVASAEHAGLIELETDAGDVAVHVGHPLYGEMLRATLRPLETRRHLSALAETARDLGWSESEPLRTATWLLEGGGRVDDPMVFEVAASRALAVRDVRRTERLARVAIEHGGTDGAALTLAASLVASEQWDEAEDLLDGLLERPVDDLTLVHAARTQANVLHHGRDDPQRAREVLAGAAARVPEGPPRAWLHVQESMVSNFGGDPASGERLARAAVHEAGASPVRVHALWALALASVLQGRTAAALEAAEECLPFVNAAFEDDPTASVLGPVYALALTLDGRLGDAAEYASAVLAQAQRRHAPAYWATPQSVAAWVALVQGRLADARRLADAALVTFREDNTFGGGDWCTATLAAALAQAGDADAADEALAWTDTHPNVPRIYRPEVERARAWALAARGEVSGAQRIALAAADETARSGSSGSELPALLDVLRLGDLGVAPRLIEMAGRLEGAYAAATGAYAAALAARDGPGLDAASERFDAMGARLLAAEASAEAARAHAAAGRAGASSSSMARAVVLRAHCDGARTPALRDVGAHPGLATLTAREREVAELACHHSNREVADRLYVSVRTVHTHLQHAYAKLGVNDRGDLAALLAASDSA